MTSDAKIGLLLGLVFIFVIAFIINGLPNFGAGTNAEATPMMSFQNEDFGLVPGVVPNGVRTNPERLDWNGLLEQEGQDRVVAQEPAVELEPAAARSGRETGEIRRVYTLDDLVGGMSDKIQNVVKNLIEPVPAQQPTTQPAPAIESPKPDTVQSPPAETAAARSSSPAPAASSTQRPTAAAPRIYVVEAGDVLATVAKKAYGPEEGNRLVNVNRIFEANRDSLKSPDEIVVGQKLVIPPLPGAKPDATLSQAVFEKVEQIGKRNVAEVQAPKPGGTVYVVQDGDSLWKIASSQLGSGARWEEIVKLNTDTLKSKDATLVIGMQLKLPPK
jgi:nucleoid-associated protein YgaU